MTFNVRLQHTEKSFVVNGFDSLLDSALKAGIALPYGCSNGNCGECQARIVQGEVKRVKHHDFVIPQVRKLSGHTLLCSYAPLTDLILDATEASDSQDIQQQTISAKIKSIHVDESVAIVRAQTPRSQRLRYLAGQQVHVEFADQSRTLPLASCPCEDRMLEFHIPIDHKHKFSKQFSSISHAPKQIQVTGPADGFVLDHLDDDPLLFIAFEAGFASVKSVIEHCFNIDYAGAIRLVRISSGDKQPYENGLVRGWVDAMDNFSCQVIKELSFTDFIPSETIFAAGKSRQLKLVDNAIDQAGICSDRLQYQRLA